VVERILDRVTFGFELSGQLFKGGDLCVLSERSPLHDLRHDISDLQLVDSLDETDNSLDRQDIRGQHPYATEERYELRLGDGLSACLASISKSLVQTRFSKLLNTLHEPHKCLVVSQVVVVALLASLRHSRLEPGPFLECGEEDLSGLEPKGAVPLLLLHELLLEVVLEGFQLLQPREAPHVLHLASLPRVVALHQGGQLLQPRRRDLQLLRHLRYLNTQLRVL
jgi:hypothetical protein